MISRFGSPDELRGSDERDIAGLRRCQGPTVSRRRVRQRTSASHIQPRDQHRDHEVRGERFPGNQVHLVSVVENISWAVARGPWAVR